MNRFFTALVAFVALAGTAHATEVNVVTDRSDFHLRPLLKQFEQQTGIHVNAVYLQEGGLLARLEQRPNEGDLVVTSESSQLETAKQKGFLQKYTAETVNQAIPADYRDADGYWAGLSYRARAIAYSKDRVKPEQLSTYEDLADPKWKGRVCIRSGYSNYNVSLIANMVAERGPEYTRTWLQGVKDNLARKPQGNDREQAKGIYEGKCDVALVNTYYFGLMLTNPAQRDWGNAVRAFFPDQQQQGAYVLLSNAGVLKGAKNTAEANKLLAYLTGEFAQQWMTTVTYEYPLVRGEEPLPEMVRSFGQEQGIKDGQFKARPLHPATIARYREVAVKLLDEVNFDQK